MGQYDPPDIRASKARAKRARQRAKRAAREIAHDRATFTADAFREASSKRRRKRQGCPSRARTWSVSPETTAQMGRADYGDLVPAKHGGVVNTSAPAIDRARGDRRLRDFGLLVTGSSRGR